MSNSESLSLTETPVNTPVKKRVLSVDEITSSEKQPYPHPRRVSDVSASDVTVDDRDLMDTFEIVDDLTHVLERSVGEGAREMAIALTREVDDELMWTSNHGEDLSDSMVERILQDIANHTARSVDQSVQRIH